ncbi:MAG: ATP-binding domain-containing protein [Candidatus Scatomorpha sp.]|jgi:DNA replication protein DnaC
MAKMIPDMPREFDPKSKEGLMFDELNRLSDEYYVFHSFTILSVSEYAVSESETDFVIFHPQKGILCVEAKAGQADYAEGNWRYGSGRIMKKGGPYNQAKANKWKFKDYMIERGMQREFERCKLLHAVWFPDVPLSRFEGRSLPSDADLKITLTADSFGKIEEEIERIFALEIPANVETNLSEADTKLILERVLAPSFSLISLQEVEVERRKNVFKRMLREQVALLNYLEEQNNAIINGFAGTGKTVMAIEKAKIHSDKGENVLFLCYNSLLKDYLREAYAYERVDYYTIAGFACKLCDTSKYDYGLLKARLEEMYIEESFPYQHVIIDEGQDFGKEELEEEEIIELLKMNAIDNESRNGTFYLFYDRNQMVQSRKVPKYIEEADCKLTLYRNCRNTENIATTSLRLLGPDIFPKLFKDAVKGDVPEMGFAMGKEETIAMLNTEINKFFSSGYESITILTCKTEESSIIAPYCKDSKYNFDSKHVKFTTCRKFKGLESDAIIVVDIDKTTFEDSQGEQLMYVGTSRARHKLSCIVNMDKKECMEIMNERKIKYNSKNAFKSFATAFNAKAIRQKK